ncbi:MAG: hypothetical protein WD844_13260 [Thermoleophilaceae bacterium]
MKTIRRLIWVTALALALWPAASFAATRAVTPTSAWQKVAPNALNVAFPDEYAVYYVIPYIAGPGLRTLVEGQVPAARYWSHTIYQTQGGALDNIDGDRMALDADGSYRMTIADRCAEAQRNCLSTTRVQRPTPTFEGMLVYRLYVPEDIASGQTGGVPVPRATYEADGPDAEARLDALDLPAAAREARDVAVSQAALASQELVFERSMPLSGPVPQPDNDPPVRSFRFHGHQGSAIDYALTKGLISDSQWALLNSTLPNPSGTGGPFSAPANEYTYIFYQHERGNLVVSAKAPTYDLTSSSRNAFGRDDGGEQVRYWSLCTNSSLTRYIDCIKDEDVVIPPGETHFEIVVSPTCPVAGYANCLLSGQEAVEFAVVYRNQLASAAFKDQQLAGEWAYGGHYVSRP